MIELNIRKSWISQKHHSKKLPGLTAENPEKTKTCCKAIGKVSRFFATPSIMRLNTEKA